MDRYELTNLIIDLIATAGAALLGITGAALLYIIANVTRGFLITLGAILALKLFGLI